MNQPTYPFALRQDRKKQEIWRVKCGHRFDDSRMRREFVNQWTVEMAIMLPHTVVWRIRLQHPLNCRLHPAHLIGTAESKSELALLRNRSISSPLN